jgi:hypothetical protein
MNRFRFSIAQLMAIIFYFGFGFAALRIGGAIWASLTFDLAIIAIAAAIVGAYAQKDKGRMTCAGFATAGAIRLAVWTFAHATVGSLYGPPHPFLYHLQEYINPMATGGGPLIWYSQIATSLDVLLVGLVGGLVGHFIAVKKDRPNL